MKTVIENSWFPAGTRIHISGGSDELLFRHCSFEGGEIFVEHDVGCTIFSHCLFRGTSFSGQLLSERISIECHTAPPETEETAAAEGSREGKFHG